MPKYLIKASYTADGAKGLLKDGGSKRRTAAEQAIKSSIDAQLTAHSITSNDQMMELISDIERANNAWAVGRFDAIASHARLPEEVRGQIPAITTFAVMSHIDGGVTGTLRAEARDDQSAENLRDVVRGFLALGKLQGQNDPKVSAMLQSPSALTTQARVTLLIEQQPLVHDVDHEPVMFGHALADLSR